ncbi:MAG: AAA family ATPase [Candidatus Spechtbacteria bacterium]|nr:AAA family ATPase [Candidatus Spechtbacteria bacterium]
MSKKSAEKKGFSEPKVQYGIPALNFLGPATDKIAPLTPSLSAIAIALFIMLGGLFSFVGLYAIAPNLFPGFDVSFFVAGLYGLFAVLVCAALIFGYFDHVKRKTKDEFKLDQVSVEADREALAQHYAQKNRRQFYSNALFVFLSIVGATVIFWQKFDMYPSETFLMSWPVLFALWVFLLFQFSRPMLIILVLVMVVMRIAMVLMGAQVLVQFLPYLLMMPMFVVMNFVMMFGPLAFINIMQIKTILPGEGKIDEGKKVMGQRQAMKQLEHDLMLFISKKGEELGKKGSNPPRGILMKGPPGVGKTLFAKSAASKLSCPLVITQGSAYIATFMGIDILVMMYTRMKVNALAKEWGRAILFIDEADQLLMRRGGMTSGAPGAMSVAKEFWSLFEYDAHGSISPCGLVFTNGYTREIMDARASLGQTVHPQMFPGMFGGGGGSMAIYPFLTWLDGVESPPWQKAFVRNKINMLLDVLLVVPLSWRLPPIKSVVPKVLFLAATNRPQVIDPAMQRPGRFGRHVEFPLPDEQGREEIIKGYLEKIAHHPILATNDKVQELARATVGLSPADIEQILRDAVSIQYTRVMRVKWLQDRKERGEELEEMEQEELKRADEWAVKDEKWDEIWATWDSMVDSLATKRFGAAQSLPTTVEKKKNIVRLTKNTAFHELGGHFLTLKAFCSTFQKPTFMSAVPRGETLGLVAHVPVEDREDFVQWMIEGLMRVSVGSLAAERIFLEDGDNGPGVSRDLENATSMALRMTAKWGMSPRKCRNKKEEARYEEIGEIVLSLPEMDVMEHGAPSPLSGLMGFKNKKRNFAIVVGQAFVDAWRIIKKNKNLVPPMVEKLVADGELTGNDLENLWKELDEKLQPLTLEDDRDDNWPDMTSPNRFYKEKERENVTP